MRRILSVLLCVFLFLGCRDSGSDTLTDLTSAEEIEKIITVDSIEYLIAGVRNFNNLSDGFFRTDKTISYALDENSVVEKSQYFQEYSFNLNDSVMNVQADCVTIRNDNEQFEFFVDSVYDINDPSGTHVTHFFNDRNSDEFTNNDTIFANVYTMCNDIFLVMNLIDETLSFDDLADFTYEFDGRYHVYNLRAKSPFLDNFSNSYMNVSEWDCTYYLKDELVCKKISNTVYNYNGSDGTFGENVPYIYTDSTFFELVID